MEIFGNFGRKNRPSERGGAGGRLLAHSVHQVRDDGPEPQDGFHGIFRHGIDTIHRDGFTEGDGQFAGDLRQQIVRNVVATVVHRDVGIVGAEMDHPTFTQPQAGQRLDSAHDLVVTEELTGRCTPMRVGELAENVRQKVDGGGIAPSQLAAEITEEGKVDALDGVEGVRAVITEVLVKILETFHN